MASVAFLLLLVSFSPPFPLLFFYQISTRHIVGGETTERVGKSLTWCFRPSQPLRFYQCQQKETTGTTTKLKQNCFYWRHHDISLYSVLFGFSGVDLRAVVLTQEFYLMKTYACHSGRIRLGRAQNCSLIKQLCRANGQHRCTTMAVHYCQKHIILIMS